MAKNSAFEEMPADGSSVESSGEGKSRISSVDRAGDYQAPDLSNYDTHKSFGKNTSPLQCRNSKAHKGRLAIIAPTLTGGDRPTPMCSTCWDKIKTTPEKFETSPQILHNDPAQRASLRSDLAKIEGLGRARDAAKIHEITGKEIIVQGPGRRPRISSKIDATAETGRGTKDEISDQATDEWLRQAEAKRSQESGTDALATTLRRSETSGGRNRGPEHEETLDKAHRALVSSLGDGGINASAYHEHAASQGLDRSTALAYLPLAINKHRQLTKSSVVRPSTAGITGSYIEEPIYESPIDETQKLMESGAPAPADTKR